MDYPAKKHQDRLETIKTRIRNTYESWRPNYQRFDEFRRFVMETSLDADALALLEAQKKPQLEFNVLEAYMSRLLGEFAKQEPSIIVSSDDQDQIRGPTVDVVEKHIRHILMDSKNHHTKYEVYKDLLSGGFSVMKVSTDYASPMSFHQVINVDRVKDPCLCGFDPISNYSHKGDGRFCFELFPMSKDEFEETYPDVEISNISFARGFAGFNWSYMNNKEKVVIIADYYEKKAREMTIVQLSDGKVMDSKKYEKMVEEWDDLMSVPPEIVGKPRKTTLDVICRTRLMTNKVLEYVETDFAQFPLIFVDGNSVMLKLPNNGAVTQFTKPYFFHAKGAQRLKNYAGVTTANEIENMVQHKIMVSKEALPKEADWMAAYKNVQLPSVLVYNQFDEHDTTKALQPPMPIPRVPPPPEIFQTFVGADSMIQNILGSYDSALGINDNQLSGKAIIAGATNSNAAAMPYIVGFLHGLQRVAEIIVDLIPKYYTTPRTIPIQDEEGKKSYIRINDDQGNLPEGQETPIYMDYDENSLNVVVEAGVSFQVQKDQALQQLIMLQQANPMFAEFMGSKGMSIMLDNVDMRGIDKIKELAAEWEQEMEQKRAMEMEQMAQEGQMNPLLLGAQVETQKIQQRAQSDQYKNMIDMQKLKLEEQKLQATMRMEEEDNRIKEQELAVKREQVKHEIVGMHHSNMLKHEDMKHGHKKDIYEAHERRHDGNNNHQ